MKKESRNILIAFNLVIAVIIAGIALLINITNSAPSMGDERVEVADAKAAYDEGKVLIIDVRSEAEFEYLHIKGAVLIEVHKIKENEPAVEKNSLIYTYCT
ncbi:MAG: rhodanese-like domain-containing protein [Anaerolineaceae bacterium]|nr:rhodanese-like domain-containing protein [Anaerolineaceae bacterium]